VNAHAGAPARRRTVSRGAGFALPVAAYLAVALTSRTKPGSRERALFTRINDGPDWPWLRLPQQLGTPWVLPGLGLALLAAGRRREALIAAAALPTVKGFEVATKKLLRRPRPLYTTPTELRDDAPVEGPSFPSGHTAIATCATLLLAPYSPAPVRAVLAAAVALTGYVRVHQGAHHPSDVVGGLFLGWAVVSGLDRAVLELSRRVEAS
jgi:membrane-associated phospholipid phosphatase